MRQEMSDTQFVGLLLMVIPTAFLILLFIVVTAEWARRNCCVWLKNHGWSDEALADLGYIFAFVLSILLGAILYFSG